MAVQQAAQSVEKGSERAPPKILVVDEEPAARERITRALHLAGYREVFHAANGEMARRILDAQGPFALVILSLRLPDESGLALLADLAPRAPETIVIMTTAGHGLLSAIDCLKHGAYDYVLKPIDFEGIQLSVGVALKRRQHELSEMERHREVEALVEERLSILEETRSALLLAVCRMAEFGSPGTHVHPERVARYSRIMAEELGRRSPYAPFVTAQFLHNLPEAALLHDIGKLTLPGDLLSKEGPLTPAEEVLLQGHAAAGRDICLAVARRLEGGEDSFVHMAAEVTASHHERWDGKGYPAGLNGPEIPLSARIVGLADYYDVWRTPMAYRLESRPAWRVAEMIHDQSGQKFDPAVVAAFRRCRPAIARAEKELADD
jgi:putative two-component system response regulator